MAMSHRLCPVFTSFMNMTKRILLSLVAATAALTLQTPARAADAKQPPSPPPGDRPAAARDRMQAIASELNLTPEQTVKLQTIVRANTQKMRELRQDTNLPPEEKRQKLAAARQEIVAEVKKVLTPEQFEKWRAKQVLPAGGAGARLARLQSAITDLNLSDDQKEQLQPLYLEQMQKLRDLQIDSNLSFAEKLDKLKAVREEVAPKLKKVLTPDQYEKLEKDVNQWLDQLKQRLQGGTQN